MKLSTFNLILSIFLLFIYSNKIIAQSRIEELHQKRLSMWNQLIPDYHKIQYAGSMGQLSFGTGWSYGNNNNWETEFFFGYVPKYENSKFHLTFTVKQNFIPWHYTGCNKKYNILLQPVTLSLYFSRISGEHFWNQLPERYPDKYYILATQLRLNLAIGQSFKIKSKKKCFFDKIGFFYEIGTNEIYLIEYILNKSIRIQDIISLSFGMQFHLYNKL